MADVDIEVESNDLKIAIELLEGYEAAFIKMVNSVQTESNRMTRASKASAAEVQTAFDRMTAQISSSSSKAATDWRKLERELSNGFAVIKRSANEVFNKDLISGNLSGLSAKNSVFAEMLKEEEKAIKAAAIASEKYEKEIQQLTQKYNPLVAASQYYEKEVTNIKRAHDLGVTSAKQMESQLEQLKIEFNALNKGTYLAGSRFNQFGEMADGAGKSAQRFGMYAQQVGYQFGDLMVQIQGGTNVGVAFSQQMAQLSGLIPGVTGALTTFAAIGVGMFIQYMTSGEKKAEDFKKVVSEFNEFSSIFETVASDLDRTLGGALDRIAEKYGTLVSEMADMRRKAAIDTLIQGLEKAVPRATTYNPQGSATQGWFGNVMSAYSIDAGMGDALAEQAKEANVVIDELRAKIKELGSDTTLTTDQMLRNFKAWTDEVLNSTTYTEQQKEAIKAFVLVSNLDLEIAKQRTEEEKKKVEESQKLQGIYEQQQQKIFEATRELRQQAELEEVKTKYGETSLNYLTLQKEQTLANYEADMRRLGLNQTVVDVLVEQLAKQLDIQIAMEATNAKASDVLSVLESISGMDISGVFTRAQGAANALLGTVNAIGRAMAAAGKLALENEALKAQAEALRGGASPARAKVAGDVVRYGQTLPQGGGIVGDVVRGAMSKANERLLLDKLAWEEQIASDTKSYNDANKPGGGGKGRKGGKSDAEKAADKAKKAQEKINEKFVDFLEDFALRMEQQKRLVGVYGEQRDQLEKVIEIENRLGDARQLASQDQIEAWAREELALENLREMQDSIFDTLSGNIENFLMDVVDGTDSIGEAFRNMLSGIIREMYQTMVAKPAAGFAGNFIMSLFSAKGNAFGAGGVKMFANGGVVDSPTAFKYSGGLGVMGEAGPEAIMPLKRNSQGKLGVAVENASSGDIKVTQVFQFSANGDESVKAIIKQQLPKIQENTVQAVIEAKRRGRNGL